MKIIETIRNTIIGGAIIFLVVILCVGIFLLLTTEGIFLLLTTEIYGAPVNNWLMIILVFSGLIYVFLITAYQIGKYIFEGKS